jgi:tetratricopeptide (TPR) repeat protein
MWKLLRARRYHRRALLLWREGRWAAGQQQGARAVALFAERRDRFPASQPGELVAALLTLARFHTELAAHAAAERLLRQAVGLLSNEPERVTVGATLIDVLTRLGNGQRLQGDYAEAEATLREAAALVDVGRLGPEWLGAVHNVLGMVCKDTGRYGESAEHYARALALSSAADPGTRANVYHNLAGLAHVQGRFTEAEAPARQALALRAQASEPHSTEVAADIAVLGAVLTGLQRYDDAEMLFRRALGMWSRRFGPHHYEVAVNLHSLAVLHQQRGEPERALHDFQEALQIKKSTLGPGHFEVGAILNNLAALHADQGRTDEAVHCYFAALAILDRTLGEEHPSTVCCRDSQRRLQAQLTIHDELARVHGRHGQAAAWGVS